MSSISSLLATAIAAVMPFAGSTGPVDAQDQLSQPDPAETAQTAPDEAGEQPTQDQQPGAHAEKGRITGDKEDVINGEGEGADEVDPGFNGGNLQTGKLAVQRELTLATQEVGHEFMNIEFKDEHSAHLTFPETYNPDKDGDTFEAVSQLLQEKGYQVTAVL